MITQILFEIPSMYEAAVNSGTLIRVGGLLKDAASGAIVAHLQESPVAHLLISKAVGTPMGPIRLAIEAFNVASGIYTAVEVKQIKSLISSLQTLCYGTLGVSLIGVGVTVAGIVYMHKRFNALEGRIDELIKSMESGFASQREAALRAHVSQVNGLVKSVMQAPTLSRPEREYSRVAEAMTEQAAHFEGELEFLIKADGKISVEIFWQLAQLLTLSNSIRIDCRMRSNELKNARQISESVAEDYKRLFDPLSAASFHFPEGDGATVAKTLREITDAAITKPYLIEYLRTQRISGADYIDRLERETENPILILKAA